MNNARTRYNLCTIVLENVSRFELPISHPYSLNQRLSTGCTRRNSRSRLYLWKTVFIFKIFCERARNHIGLTVSFATALAWKRFVWTVCKISIRKCIRNWKRLDPYYECNFTIRFSCWIWTRFFRFDSHAPFYTTIPVDRAIQHAANVLRN